MIIYKITNLKNNKVYIGQTVYSLAHRKSQHLQNARKGMMTKLYDAIREYGEENFKFEVVAHVKTKEELNRLETYFMKKYNSVEEGYNMYYGGWSNAMFTEEIKERHDKVMRSEDVRKRISESLKKYRREHPFTKEHRKKISMKAMGNHNGAHHDSNSKKCYCVDHNDGDAIHHFKSYKEGGLWWYEKYKPFGERYAQSTYQKRIVESINTGSCHYGRHGKNRTFVDVQWFRYE